jgi:hypothetical protein
MSLKFDRSVAGYGWTVTLYVKDRQRIRYHSPRATSIMWPGIHRGADEHCNRSLTFMFWPLGHIDVWWEPASTWRTVGMCDECTEIMYDLGVCTNCGAKPCCCDYDDCYCDYEDENPYSPLTEERAAWAWKRARESGLKAKPLKWPDLLTGDPKTIDQPGSIRNTETGPR